MNDSARDLSRADTSAYPSPETHATSTLQRRDRDPSARPIWHPKSKIRRDMMRALGICINGSFVMPPATAKPGEQQKLQSRAPTITYRAVVQHGPAVKGGRCQRCINTRRGIEDTTPLAGPLVYTNAPMKYVLLRAPPPGTKRRRWVELLMEGHSPQEVAAIDNTHRQNIHSAVRFARKIGELA